VNLVVPVAVGVAMAVVVVPGVIWATRVRVQPCVFLALGVLVVGVRADAGERADCQHHWDEHAGGDCREAYQNLMHDSQSPC